MHRYEVAYASAWSQRVPAATRRRVQRALDALPGRAGVRPDEYREAVLAGMKKVAAAWGGACLSEAYASYQVPLEFRCAAGHRFPMLIRPCAWGIGALTAPMIGRWCIRSRRRARLPPRVGGSACRYVNTREKMRWRCEAGHTWSACLDGVLQGDCAGRVISSASSRSRKRSTRRPLPVGLRRQGNAA